MMTISDEVVGRYLARLGMRRRPPATLSELVRLHQRHVQRISYQNLDIQLGRQTTVRPADNAERLAAGEGGYCFHLNGSFAALLLALGFKVTLHRGQVKKDDGLAFDVTSPNHLAMTVRVGDALWFVDVGLGDGLFEPLPLRPGTVHQPPFTFRLTRSDPGWRFSHDPGGSFTVMDFEDRPARPEDFAEPHRLLSTDPTSTFVRRFIVMNRTPGRVLSLVDCCLSRIESGRVTRQQLHTFEEWRAALTDSFLLRLGAADDVDLLRLWARLQHRRGTLPSTSAS